uniref:Uncharacterized protein n=1 Tax=Coptotermes formosanus TaxID=36987 RepID=R4V3H7_COPFO|nr:hypothetical protein [Coptotermes formosanus]
MGNEQKIIPLVEKYKISSSNSSKVDLFSHRIKLDRFEHWIFVSSDFEFSSYELKTQPNKTIFIILDNLVDEIYQSNYQENKILKSVLIFLPFENCWRKCFSLFSFSTINFSSKYSHFFRN